jgi:hypothetical protein
MRFWKKRTVEKITVTQESTIPDSSLPGRDSFPIPLFLHRFEARSHLSINPRYRSRARMYVDVRAKGIDDKEQLAKNLHQFLTSWGFSERTSLVLPSDSRLLIPLIEIILDPIFTPLRDSTASNLLDPNVQKLILLAASRLSNAYREIVHTSLDNSDELVTHIIATTFGSIPPFDNYLQKGMRVLGLGPDSFSVGAINTLANYYIAHEVEFETFRKQLGTKGLEYSQMAILGFYLWEIGNENMGKKT